MGHRKTQPMIDQREAEILTAGVTGTPYVVGERLLRFDYGVGGHEPVILVANPLPGSIQARVTRGEGSDFLVPVPYLYRDNADVRAYMAKVVELGVAVRAWSEAVVRLDPKRGHAARLVARPLRARISETQGAAADSLMSPNLHPYPYPFRASYLEPRYG